MSLQFPDQLPSHAPVLISRPALNLGHRPVDGRPACGSTEPMHHATALQCRAWRVLPCPSATCWNGRMPW